MKRIALVFLAAAALTACATETGEPQGRGLDRYADDPRLGEETNRICFASSIDGFSENERTTVVLHEGGDRYMVEVSGSCFDLETAQSIGIDSPTGCLTPGDAIIVGDTFGGSGIGPRRCLIREIRNWDPKAKKVEGAAAESPA